MSGRPLRPATARVPGSTSNLGAGFDCLGLAFRRYLEATFQPEDRPLALESAGTLAGVAASDDILLAAFRARTAQHGLADVRGRIHARSDIPVARGLGSSAAATVAGLLLADAALGVVSDRAELLRIATLREGHPDNAAPALLGGLVAVARALDHSPHAFPLPLSPDVGFVYAAPEVEVATPAARAALPAQVPHPLAGRALGRTAALVRGLATADPDLLRLGLLDELHVPWRLPLIPRAEAAFDAAVAAGAWGATISGSGSGLIALCPPAHAGAVLDAMERALRADGLACVGFVAAADLAGAQVRALEAAC